MKAFSGLSTENASTNRVDPGSARVPGRRAVPAASPAAEFPEASEFVPPAAYFGLEDGRRRYIVRVR